MTDEAPKVAVEDATPKSATAAAKPEDKAKSAAPPSHPQPVGKAAAAAVQPDEEEVTLSESEKDKIRREVRAELRAERKKSMTQQFREEETRRLRMEEGMVVGGAEDEMVTITLDLAKHTAHLTVNLRPYWHGHTYTVSRHIARSLVEQMWRGWGHQYEIEGKTRFDFYSQMRATEISPVRGTKNAPQRAALPGQG